MDMSQHSIIINSMTLSRLFIRSFIHKTISLTLESSEIRTLVHLSSQVGGWLMTMTMNTMMMIVLWGELNWVESLGVLLRLLFLTCCSAAAALQRIFLFPPPTTTNNHHPSTIVIHYEDTDTDDGMLTKCYVLSCHWNSSQLTFHIVLSSSIWEYSPCPDRSFYSQRRWRRIEYVFWVAGHSKSVTQIDCLFWESKDESQLLCFLFNTCRNPFGPMPNIIKNIESTVRYLGIPLVMMLPKLCS